MSKFLILLQQENLELNRENVALKETVTKLIEEVERLRSLPVVSGETNITIIGATRITKSTEENIIEDQIKCLDQASRQRVLSLEEIRSLDLLIKNKKLLETVKPIEPDYTKVPDGQTESDLIRIAGNVDIEPDQARESDATAEGS